MARRSTKVRSISDWLTLSLARSMFPWLRLNTGRRSRDSDSPRSAALPAVGRIVLPGVRLKIDVRVLKAVGALKLDVGLGDESAEAIGGHVGAAFERDLVQLVVRMEAAAPGLRWCPATRVARPPPATD